MDEISNNNQKEEEIQENQDDNNQSNVVEFFEYREGIQKPNLTPELEILHELTKIDKELAEIQEQKGDLPDKIVKLEKGIDDIRTRISETDAKYEQFVNEELLLNKESKDSEDKMNKYDELKYSAKSNKEYDEITKSIDVFLEVLEKNEKRLKEISAYKSALEKEKANYEEKLNEEIKELDDDKELLDELNKEFEDEEIELNNKKENQIVRLKSDVRSLYERINSSLSGEATAIIRKGNCSGCYNSVPPQREIEIKMAGEIYLCQSCGRILIDESVLKK